MPHTHREEEASNGGEEDQPKDPQANTVHSAVRVREADCHPLSERV